MDSYILNADKTVSPVASNDPRYRQSWSDRSARRVDRTELDGGTLISTVFLVIDHSFNGGPPILFETMVFRSSEDMSEQLCWRYQTYEEAQMGHKAAVEATNGFIDEGRNLSELCEVQQP